MSISLEKCRFGFQEPKALEYVVSGLSLGIDKNKLAGMLLNPMPQRKKEIMSFLGFSIYYRQHIEEFAILEESIYRIWEPHKVFKMTPEMIIAYHKIKHSLTYATLLLIPDWNIPFDIFIYASGEGVGAPIHQVQIPKKNLMKYKYVLFLGRLNIPKEYMGQEKCKSHVWFGPLRDSITV
ncbi:hypothetical protein O181_059699 [Austropuccinia psidii MF-1]|uniref:Reverse transcriptase/retrotransposon-derived protein RNase H-like domain-containing protein n=1 Tax=Austropuccinia psidii MF-1 TaxID=1389203 RepID=A0A9Q3HYW3_9BASI|nr:hypothetical protein [Austropuccinia psidii MF-1]